MKPFVTAALWSLLPVFAHASLERMEGQFSPGFIAPFPETSGQVLTSIRIQDSNDSFRTPTGAVFLSNSGGAGSLFGTTGEGTPASTSTALTGLGFTTGQTNMQSVSFTLPTTVNGDFTRMFIGEISINGQLGDQVTVRPLSGGSVIPGWELAISSSDWGDQTNLWDATSGLPDIAGRMVSFQLSDFTGGTGTLTGVDGLQLIDNFGAVDFDPNIAGTVGASVLVPGASAAYSLRLLDGDYTGSAIEVRRSSDGTLMDIGFDSFGDLDVAALEAFLAGSDGFVQTWYDQSGGGADVNNTIGVDQPRIATAGTVERDPNGNIAIRFDGGDGLGVNQAFFAPTGDTSVFTTAAFDSGVPSTNLGTQRLFNFAQGGSSRLSTGADGGNFGIFAAHTGFTVTPSSRGVTANELVQVSLNANEDDPESLSLAVNRDSVLNFTVPSFTNNEDRLIIGAQELDGGRGFSGWMHELVIYNQDLTAEEISRIQLNQMAAVGIVPEPSTTLLLFSFLSGLTQWRRRRRLDAPGKRASAGIGVSGSGD